MKAEIILLLTIIHYSFQILTMMCIENCDQNEFNKLDPTKPMILMALCTDPICSSATFKWELIPDPKNTKQSFDDNDVIGITDSKITVKANVLPPGEQYKIQCTVTTAKGKTFLMGLKLNMDVCSKKFPCGGKSTVTVPPDYVGDNSFEEYILGLPPSQLPSHFENDLEKLRNVDKKSPLLKEKRKDLLLMLKYLPVQNKEQIKYCSDMLKTLLKETVSVPFEPAAAKLVLVVARSLANGRLALLRKALEPKTMTQEVKDMSIEVLSLTKVALDVSEKQLISHRPEEVSTPPSAIIEAPSREDYPIYDDFDIKYLGKRENFEAISYETIKLIESVAEANVRTMKGRVTEEQTMTDDVCILNILDNPSKTANKVFTICDVSFHISNDLANELSNKMKLSAISLGVLKKNAFWWKNENAVGYPVYVEIDDFERNAFELSTVIEHPITFFLNVKHEKTKTVDGVFKIPVDQREIRPEDISLFQLIPKEIIRTVMIQFVNLKDGDKIKVVILQNGIPSLENFEDPSVSIPIPKTDEADEKFTILRNIVIDEGSFGYVGVLPTKETLEKSGTVKDGFRYFNYTVAFTRLSCDLWSEVDINWRSDNCSVHKKTSSTTMHCSCYHTSIFAASSSNIESRRLDDWEILQLFEVEYNFVVIISVGVVIFIFILATLFTIGRQRKLRKDKKVLFLLDNRLDLISDFEYLICVFTGTKKLAGTTANIGIQIYGVLANSERHILRGQYEPVLQEGSEDWFYMLAPTDLGELTQIELWTDCHGLRVSWYCERIEIHSLLANRKWTFEVHQWFTVLSGTICSTISGNVEASKMVRTRCDYAKIGKRNHIWITPFRNLGDSPFTYLERMSVIFCIVLLNSLMAMVFLGVPYPGIYGQFGRGHFTFEFREIGMALLSAIISFSISWILIFLFEREQPLKSETDTRKPKFLRITRSYASIARVSLVTLIVISLGILSIFGIWFNYISSLVWIPIFITGILLCILFELFRVSLTAALLKQGERKIVHKLDFSEIEEQRDLLFKTFGAKAMRIFFHKLYHPISHMQQKVKREKELLRIDMRSIITDIAMFTIYIFILFNIVLLNKDNMSHKFTNTIEEIFVEDKFIREMKYKDINSNKGLYRYFKKVFFPALYTSSWYGNYNSSESGLLIDFSTKLLGIPRVRQQRVKPNSCGLHPSMVAPAEGQRCHAELGFFNEDRESYAPRWEKWRDIPAGASGIDSRKIWMYQNGYESASRAYNGELRTYYAGGYVANFGRTLENSLLVLEYIENNEWIDARTRALIFQAYFYNAYQNLFGFLTLIIERSASAKFITNYEVRTSRLLFLYGDLAIRTLILFTFFIIMMILFSWRIYKEYRIDIWTRFLSNFWNIIDILIILVAFVFVFVYSTRSLAVTKLISVLEESAHNEFISFNNILFWDDAVTILAAMLVTISTVRLWKMLRFLRIFRICETTLIMASRYLLAVAFISTILLLAYSTFGFIIFGPYSENFRSVSHGFVTLLLHSLGFSIRFNYSVLEESYWAIGPTYYVVFMLILFYIINIFIAIIIVAYEAARDYINECEKDNLVSYSLLDYLKDEWKYFRSKNKGRDFNNRLQAGEEYIEIDEIKNIEPKKDESRKEVKINSDRMESIHKISSDIMDILVDRNTGLENIELTDYEELIGELAFHLSNEEEGRRANKTEGDQFVVIPDDELYKYIATTRLEDMYIIVDYLLRNRGRMTKPEPAMMVDQTVAMIMSMNAVVLEMIKALENLSKKIFVDESTNVTFSDFGLEVVEDEDEADDVVTIKSQKEKQKSKVNKDDLKRAKSKMKGVKYKTSRDDEDAGTSKEDKLDKEDANNRDK